jgi:hypothetical protein
VRRFFAHAGRALEMRRLLGGVLGCVHQQQVLVNQWRRQVNLPVEPASERFEAAAADPIRFAQYALREVHALASDDLNVRRRAGAGGSVGGGTNLPEGVYVRNKPT